MSFFVDIFIDNFDRLKVASINSCEYYYPGPGLGCGGIMNLFVFDLKEHDSLGA